MITKQPVAYITAAIVLLQIIQSFLRNEPISMTAIDALMVATGGLFIQGATISKGKVKQTHDVDLLKLKRGLGGTSNGEKKGFDGEKKGLSENE